jgi:hypothetical protein
MGICWFLQWDTANTAPQWDSSAKKLEGFQRCRLCENPSGLWDECEAPFTVTATFADIVNCGPLGNCDADSCENLELELTQLTSSSSECVWRYPQSGTDDANGWVCTWTLTAGNSAVLLWNLDICGFCFCFWSATNDACETSFENDLVVGDCDGNPIQCYCGYDGTCEISW